LCCRRLSGKWWANPRRRGSLREVLPQVLGGSEANSQHRKESFVTAERSGGLVPLWSEPPVRASTSDGVAGFQSLRAHHQKPTETWVLSVFFSPNWHEPGLTANGVPFLGCHSRGLGVWASCLVEKIGGPIQNEFGFLHPLEPHSNLSKGISRSPTPLDLHHAGKSWLSECGLDRHDNEFLPAAESRDFEHEQAF